MSNEQRALALYSHKWHDSRRKSKFCIRGRPLEPLLQKGSDHMRTRDTQFNVRLSRQEADRLKRNSRRAGLTNSGYIRMLISGYCPKETPPVEYGEILQKLTGIYTLLQESADTAVLEELEKTLLQMQTQLTMPEEI